MLKIKEIENFSYKKNGINKGFILPCGRNKVLTIECDDHSVIHEDIAEMLVNQKLLNDGEEVFAEFEKYAKGKNKVSFKDFLIFVKGGVAVATNKYDKQIIYLDDDLEKSIEKVIFEYRVNGWSQKKFLKTKAGFELE